MSLYPQPWSRPDAPRKAAASGVGPAASLLFSRDDDRRAETRRIAAGLVVLAILSVVLLNMGIYSGARERLSRERWAQMGATLEAKREEVRDLLWQFERQAEYVAGQPVIVTGANEAIGPRFSAPALEALERELSRAARSFDFRSIQLLDRKGHVLARTSGAGDFASQPDRGLADRARTAQHAIMEDVRNEGDSRGAMMLAVPLKNAGDAPVLLFRGNVEDVLLPLLMSWPGYGPAAGAYLVKREGNDIACVTSPPASLGIAAGDRIPASRSFMRAAAMAADGVESTLETVDARGEPLWTVTRSLPERGWGLVVQVDRASALSGLRASVMGLLALDFAMLLLGIGAVWFWRRQYKAALARRESEMSMRHAARLHAIFDTAFDAILTFNREWRVVSVNRSGAALFGRGEADMEGQPFHKFLRLDAAASAGVAGTFAAGTVARAEALHASGALVPVEFSLGSAGEGTEFLYTAIVRDITDRVESEQRIRAFADGLEQSNRRLEELNAQLEEASRLKSEFLANTSHELRTPLNGMIGFLQLVLDDLCDSKEEERDFIGQALECSRHLLGLINDVLDIARIEAGKLALEITAVEPARLFDEVYSLTHVQAAQKGVRIRFEPPDDRDLRVRADFGKVKQVLINLVGNSLKFTPSGTITVRATAHPESGHFMFEVIDTGIGVPLDRQQVIFEKFIQGDGSTTRKYGGTGLGLAITRSLVELMGGIIGVQSEGEGKGTRMYFSLPMWRDPETLVPPAEDEPSEQISGDSSGALIMVVEDDAIFRRYLVELLQGHGYRTVEARHAEGAWVLVRRLRPAVVVTDYALTSLEGASLRTGWDLAERMTSDSLTRHIPIVFVTGFDEELRVKLKATAFARRPEHLVKPIDGRVLIDKLNAVLGDGEGRVLRVLMADDDPSVTAYVRKVLPVDRFHLEVAANGTECLHALRTQPRGFDLVLLDLMMPDVSGYDVLREMALTGLGSSVPVLVLTNYPEPRNEDEARLLEQGLVLDVISKATVHDNPQLLAHVIDWQLQVVRESDAPDDVGDGEGGREAA